MKKVISTILLTLAVDTITMIASAKAIDIKMQKVTFEDYIQLLKIANYHAYDFDIESLTDKMYRITFSCREYVGDSLVNKNIIPYLTPTRNMRLVSEFSDEYQASITQEEMYDASRGIYSCAEKIVLGTFQKNDSTTVLMVNVENMRTFNLELELKALPTPTTGNNQYIYFPRPFKTNNIKQDEFIPLMFYGSAWYDPKLNIIQFCGENELNPDMSNQLIKHVPHSYVLGIEITETTDRQ